MVALRERLLTIDFIRLSAKYLLYGIYLGFLRVFWKIGESSGLFGTPPDQWISDVSSILEVVTIIYALLGFGFLIEVIRRQQAQQNEPISPLVLNTLGVVLILLFVTRIDNTITSEPRTFETWAELLIAGTVQGGVYALIALGYTLVYGILFMINFAHGEVMMFGAFAGYLGMQFLIDGGKQSFEDGSFLIATFVVPILVGIMFLPLERLLTGYTNRETTNFQTPAWMFTLFSSPVRFAIGVAVGYGALVGLGGYAPSLFLVVITIVGVLFVMLCAMLASTLLSILLERVAYRPLRNAPRLAPLISAIGASIFLQQVALAIFGGNRKSYPSPRLLNDPKTFKVDLGNLGVLDVSKVGLVIVVASILLMVLLYIIIQRTKVGRAMRAVAQDKSTSALMGINVDRVIVFTFMLGASLAGAAGVLLGLRGDDIDFKFGFTPGIKAFTAAVLGGIGSIPGAMFGGFFLGIVEAVGPFLLGIDNEWKNAIAFSLLVIVLIFRPSGIFGAATEVKKV
jgi:branched-chain amino acid transport system permease protein